MKLLQILSVDVVSGFFFGQQRASNSGDLSTECWICHEKSFDECWLSGELKSCPTGACTMDVQFLAKEVQVVQAGCSSLNTCVANVKQNFASFRGEIVSLDNPNLHQCKIFSPSRATLNSVCRTCCTDSKCNHGWVPTDFEEWRNIDTKNFVDPFSSPFSIDFSIFHKENESPVKRTQVKVPERKPKSPKTHFGRTSTIVEGPKMQLRNRSKTTPQKSQDMRFSLNVDQNGRVRENYRGIETIKKPALIRRAQMKTITTTKLPKTMPSKKKTAAKVPIKKTLPRLSAVSSTSSTPTTKRPGPWSHLPQWKINQLRRLRQKRLEAKRLEEEGKSA
ncbi:Oidioi.mRNA.OKI2018_I69.XSR.g16119.t1.cds [Oikopleura dioica]|uniref:Oidioi.mRNA.OKI2018_I69.XSR.g16119.t1.cds n=1 Tax=Oikopleura dioica TaxID=34765 RepID=A0ABN7SLE3_OIKDI|nr:Oidioi.mRNA.OKI2018_I69.XSR.g16119.t1.cds [Oikopleura dioica]